MKIQSIAVFVFFLISIARASNWSPEDYEIFNLNDKIQQDLGEGTSFYSWLGLPQGPKASLQEINKAYRKKSRLLHPDKFSGASKALKKQAEERFQRLSLVGNILRDQSLRKRYDFFYSKGFPKWKGTGYYYAKFRPGVVLTIFFLYVFAGVFHYIALRIHRKQDFKRVVVLKEQIIYQAWGGSKIPPADASDRKVTNEATGKQFLVNSNGNISLIDDESKEQFLLDENDINLNPFFRETLFFKLPCLLWNTTLGRAFKTIDTAVIYKNPTVNQNVEAKDQKKKSKVQRGERFELPNGKVVYGRPSNSRKRKQK